MNTLGSNMKSPTVRENGDLAQNANTTTQKMGNVSIVFVQLLTNLPGGHHDRPAQHSKPATVAV